MTRFRVMLKLTCPSNWIEADCRAYVERILPTREEKESVVITELLPAEEPLENECRPKS